MKAPKLSRKSSNTLAPQLPHVNPKGTLKASLEDLQHPDSRELLRQHFTGAFPEAQRRESQDWNNTSPDGGARERLSRSTSSLTVGQMPAAKSSSSSVDTNGLNTNKRLSAVAESQPQIDIEQAIKLLQELKKTASPGDLVALHKALLPTRDSIIVSPSPPTNGDRSSGIYNPSSATRRGSNLPAGLATRGGASDDLLKRKEEVVEPRKRFRRSKTGSVPTLPLNEKESKSSIAALDLADDKVPSVLARAATPAHDEYGQVGHYRSGTLRVTNGAASPEPSIAPRKSEELPSLDLRPVKTLESMRESQDFATAPTTPLDRPSLEYHMARSSMRQSGVAAVVEPPLEIPSQPSFEAFTPTADDISTPNTPRQGRPRNSSISGIPHPIERDESVPRVYKRTRPQRSRDPSRSRTPHAGQRSQSMTPRSRESSVSMLPIKTERKASMPAAPAAVSHKVSEVSLAPLRRSIDDGRVSPINRDVPRFAQRWSNRASHISQDAAADPDVSNAPHAHLSNSYADRELLLKRLSTVYDKEGDDATSHETPEAALSKLSGVDIDSPVEQAPPMPENASKRFFNNVRAARPPPRKADSGYGTDNSAQEQQLQMAKEVSRMYNKSLNVDIDEAIALDDDDARSLYSLAQILKSPDLLSPAATPSPRTPATQHKKHSSLMKFTSLLGDSSLTLSPSPTTAANADTSPLDQKNGKLQKKKLQKPMPDAVKKQLKAQRKKEKEELVNNWSAASEASTMPEVPRPKTERFSWEAPTALPTPIPTPTSFHFPPAEVVGDESFAVEADGARTPRAPDTPGRSKSRGRNRQRSDEVVPQLSDQQEKLQRSWSGKKKKTRRVSENTPSKSPSIPCISGNRDGDGDDEAPMWTDHGSVSQTLGCNPYDISTTLFRRTVALPGMVTTTIQSPHQITTTVSRGRTGGLQGMNSGMASELARLKSRDVAISNNEQIFDRPRMATPKSRSDPHFGTEAKARMPTRPATEQFSAVRSSVEGGQSPVSQAVELPARPLSAYAESIPPMPELPADVRRVMSKVNELVAKKSRENIMGPQPEVMTMQKDSAQPTPENSNRSSEDKGCDSTISVADAIKKAMDARKRQGSMGGSSVTSRKRPSGPRQKSSSSLQTQVHEILRTPSSDSIRIGLGVDTEAKDFPAPPPRNSARKTSMPEEWQQHAAMWKERRKSAGESLGKPVEVDGERSPVSPLPASPTTESPAIVVSRYITPFGKDNIANVAPSKRQRKASAADQASAYQQLIGGVDEEEARPATAHASSTERSDSSSSPASDLQLRPQTAHNTTATTPFSPIARSRSPGGRVITPSGNFHPYRPADAQRAELSRAACLAKLTSATQARATKSLDVERTPETLPSTMTSAARKDGGPLILDRYSGGLEYGFERGMGLGGSAGTRVNADRTHRKSKELSEGWGVDLSDVPVFLRRIS